MYGHQGGVGGNKLGDCDQYIYIYAVYKIDK